MLRELRLQNLRCYEDHTVTFNDHALVVGRNNAGKSTLVEALLLVSTVLAKRGRVFRPAPAWLDLPRFRVGVSPSIASLGLNLKTAFHRYSDPPAVITASFSEGAVVTIYLGREEQLFATVAGAHGASVNTGHKFQSLNLPPVHTVPQLGPLRVEEPLLSPEYVEEWMYSRLSSLHFRNQLRLMPEHFARFKALAEETWHGLRVDSVTNSQNERGPTVSLMLRDGNFTAEVGWMGHGLQMWLQIMWFLARVPETATVILDEPDVYLHPDLQRRLFRLVRRRFAQTILATHSVEIMAEADPSEILIVDKSQKRSLYANSEPGVQHVIDHIGGVHNIHLARLWNSQRLLLVEGEDLSLLRLFHSLIYPESESPLDSIPNMSIGGWGGWGYAIGSSMIVRNSVGQQVLTYCILDSDYHSPEEVRERREEAASKGIELHIWKRKEIENYLLDPPAVRRVIYSRVRAAAKCPSNEVIREKMLSVADELRDAVIDGIAERYHFSNRGLGIGGAMKTARGFVNDCWSDPERRLALVSGKHLLSGLSEWSKVTFGVSFGAGTLCRALKREEVPKEIVSVLSAIEERRAFE